MPSTLNSFPRRLLGLAFAPPGASAEQGLQRTRELPTGASPERPACLPIVRVRPARSGRPGGSWPPGAHAVPELSHASSDTLSDVLEVVRLTGALFFIVDAKTPWVAEAPASTHLAPVILPNVQHVVSYHVVSEGACWCESPGQAALRLEKGDVLVVPHGQAYQIASTCGLRTGWWLDDALGWFRAMVSGQLPFVVTEGGNGPERLQLVCGFLGCDALPFNPVLMTLPALLRVRLHDDSRSRLHALLEFALTESNRARPGSRSVLLRIAELVFVEVLRSYLTSGAGEDSSWLAGLRDPVVGRALARLHAEPARVWTLPVSRVKLAIALGAGQGSLLVPRPQCSISRTGGCNWLQAGSLPEPLR